MSNYDESVGDVDIIFAGGGTAACVAAGRLAKANPDLKILLVEGGATNFNNPTVVNPAVYLSHLAPDSKSALVSSYYKFLKYSLIMCLVLQITSFEASRGSRSDCPYGRYPRWWVVD